jgi:hypothetical protein
MAVHYSSSIKRAEPKAPPAGAIPTNNIADDVWRLMFASTSAPVDVPISTFYKHVSAANGLSEALLVPLKRLLCMQNGVDGKDTVNCERFKRVVAWFGAFYDRKQAAQVLAYAQAITTSPWFYHDMDSITAGARLVTNRTVLGNVRSKVTKTFLLRVSFTDPWNYPFTLSIIKENGDPYNIRIGRTTNSTLLRVQMVEKGPIDEFASLTQWVTDHIAEFGVSL